MQYMVHQTRTGQERGDHFPPLFAEPGECCIPLYAVDASGTLAQAVTAIIWSPIQLSARAMSVHAEATVRGRQEGVI